jgi:hypothetical protein
LLGLPPKIETALTFFVSDVKDFVIDCDVIDVLLFGWNRPPQSFGDAAPGDFFERSRTAS